VRSDGRRRKSDPRSFTKIKGGDGAYLILGEKANCATPQKSAVGESGGAGWETRKKSMVTAAGSQRKAGGHRKNVCIIEKSNQNQGGGLGVWEVCCDCKVKSSQKGRGGRGKTDFMGSKGRGAGVLKSRGKGWTRDTPHEVTKNCPQRRRIKKKAGQETRGKSLD